MEEEANFVQLDVDYAMEGLNNRESERTHKWSNPSC